MARRFYLPALLGLLVLATPSARADEAQYRRIELADGTTVEGMVLGSDGTDMELLTPRGKVKVPLMDVFGITELTEAQFSEIMSERIAYLGTRASRADLAGDAEVVGARFAAALGELPWTVVQGPAEVQKAQSADAAKALSRCKLEDVSCVGPTLANARVGSYVYGEVQPAGDQLRITFWRLDVEGITPAAQVALPYRKGSPPAEGSLLQAAAVLRGVDPPAPDPGEMPPTETTQQPEKPTASAEPSPSSRKPSTVRGGFVPLPGAPAVFAGRPEKLLPAVGLVGAATGATVYILGGVGLSVPWTESQATWADPLFLSGVGVATYLTTTIIANQILVRVLPESTATRIEADGAGLTLRF